MKRDGEELRGGGVVTGVGDGIWVKEVGEGVFELEMRGVWGLEVKRGRGGGQSPVSRPHLMQKSVRMRQKGWGDGGIEISSFSSWGMFFYFLSAATSVVRSQRTMIP